MRRRTALVLIAGMCGITASVASSETITVEPIAYHNERLYFSVGEESRIYAPARFDLIDGIDTVASARIEHAWDDIALSEPIALADSSVVGLKAVIELAEIDSVGPITVGTDISRLAVFNDSALPPRCQVITYDDSISLQDDFYGKRLDGIATFRDLKPSPAEVRTSAHPLPYVAVLSGHIGRPGNHRGQLTTSLYYRFGVDHLAMTFDGDRVHMVDRLSSRPRSGDSAANRLFPYDPDRGRRLFENLTYPTDSVSLYSGHPSLDALTHYFADLLARDRCAVEIVDNRAAADIRLEYIPFLPELPSATVYDLVHRLSLDSLPRTANSESVRRIRAELEYVENPPDPGAYYRHLERAGRIMIEDLGVFPLFQPTVFFHAHRTLKGIRVGDRGRLDLDSVYLLRLPAEKGDPEP